jgi:hypothetical protein
MAETTDILMKDSDSVFVFFSLIVLFDLEFILLLGMLREQDFQHVLQQ